MIYFQLQLKKSLNQLKLLDWLTSFALIFMGTNRRVYSKRAQVRTSAQLGVFNAQPSRHILSQGVFAEAQRDLGSRGCRSECTVLNKTSPKKQSESTKNCPNVSMNEIRVGSSGKNTRDLICRKNWPGRVQEKVESGQRQP